MRYFCVNKKRYHEKTNAPPARGSAARRGSRGEPKSRRDSGLHTRRPHRHRQRVRGRRHRTCHNVQNPRSRGLAVRAGRHLALGSCAAPLLLHMDRERKHKRGESSAKRQHRPNPKRSDQHGEVGACRQGCETVRRRRPRRRDSGDPAQNGAGRSRAPPKDRRHILSARRGQDPDGHSDADNRQPTKSRSSCCATTERSIRPHR